MQATLVAYYGDKPTALSQLILQCQEKISNHLKDAFKLYQIQQIHATIIGMEGYIKGNKIININFKEMRNEIKEMQLDLLLTFLRTTKILPISIQIGGFSRHVSYSFSSQEHNLYKRSFSIQNRDVVVIGWPIRDNEYSDSLFNLRRECEKFNILHKYHKTDKSSDNDFFLKIGTIDKKKINDTIIKKIEEEIRSLLAVQKPLILRVKHKYISVVCYFDSTLPLNTSIKFQIEDNNLTIEDILTCYRKAHYYKRGSDEEY